MALYFAQVSIDIPVVIEAEDEDHAWEIARDDIRDILGDVILDRLVKTHVVREVSKAEELPTGWDDRCIPYGGDGNTRIAEILGRVEGRGGVKTRNYDWYDTEKGAPAYGFQVFMNGEWAHPCEDGRLLVFPTKEERDTKRKEVSKIKENK